MKKLFWIFLSLIIVFSACKKKSNDNNTGWTEEDWAFYHNVLALQDKAYENYITWSQSMDSLEAINKLHQFFISDPSVSSATISSQGITVQYTNGLCGGVFLNPQNDPVEDSLSMGRNPLMPSSALTSNSQVNKKNMIFISPCYWQWPGSTDLMINKFSVSLPKVGFNIQTILKNEEANVANFTMLGDYGIIYFDSHGIAWPKETNIDRVYLVTGEVANDETTKAFSADFKKGWIGTFKMPTSRIKGTKAWDIVEEVYVITEQFISAHNDFSKDTILVFGGFCYSALGGWTFFDECFTKASYFGFDWSVGSNFCANLSVSLIDSLCDTLRKPPYNTWSWLMGDHPHKSYKNIEGKTVRIACLGDKGLTLWKSKVEIVTNPITDITQTTATGGGTIKSDGGYPITARGVCWETSPNPTTANSKTTDGSGTGSFTSNLTGLTVNTLYYVRAYSTNSAGTVYGNQLSFTTLENSTLPTVTTASISDITGTTATGGGEVVSDGGAPVIARGICWSQFPNPTMNDFIANGGTGTGSFTCNLTGLYGDRKYYVRAWARNNPLDNSCAYGNEVSFTTAMTFQIGQNYGGGIIFYIDGTGQHGLIAAESDQSGGAEWGCVGTIIGGTSTAIGTGQANTTAIVNGCDGSGFIIAARMCDDLVLNGYDDWFLPSKDELIQGLAVGVFPGFHVYWSSSECDADRAWAYYGGIYEGGKDNEIHGVRAIRAF